MQEREDIARKLFTERGIVVGEVLPESIPCHVKFGGGGECHAFSFEGGAYIHFHIGRGAWADHCLPTDAPEIRIRSMEYQGKQIAESEWFSC